ncbi:hypothetical protein MTR67_039291 [Solanum verrucosum]|uniref:Secreted protein n=1 Tax=Solanum verrucosum TaxID=315347 RepID=A0AAF0UHT2_SOLVR|nr:hypothetical protein MTR67_039291 [Solanum verrucosum]
MESAVHMLLSLLISISRILMDGLRYGLLRIESETLALDIQSDVWARMLIMRPVCRLFQPHLTYSQDTVHMLIMLIVCGSEC